MLGYAAGAEELMVLILTLPGTDAFRKGRIAVTRNLLKPFLTVFPFSLFLLMDLYWKYETRPRCESDSCSPTEFLRHQKSVMKSQHYALLIAAALVFCWLLYSMMTKCAAKLSCSSYGFNVESVKDGVVKVRVKKFKMCPASMSEYIPCMDKTEAIRKLNSTERGERFERHCPGKGKGLDCMVPAPKKYKTPIP